MRILINITFGAVLFLLAKLAEYYPEYSPIIILVAFAAGAIHVIIVISRKMRSDKRD